MASPSDPPIGRAGDTEQLPVARTGAHAAQPSDAAAPSDGPAHAVGADSGSGVGRGGWWTITIVAAVLLILGFLLTFGPARYWTPVPVVFLGYFLVSGLIGLVFWKGVRELRDSNPTLHSGDGPASPGARVAAAISAVGVASALILLPAGLTDAPAANAAPCPDGTNTCGPQPTMGPQPTQGNGGNTTAPQAPNTTVPGYTPPDTPPQQGSGSTPTVQGQVPTMPTGDTPPNGCIFNCPTQAPQAPQTGQANPPQTGQQQNPVTTAPNTPATTPQAPTTTPKLQTPTPETTSTTSNKRRDRDDQQRSSDEDREKNSGIPYQAAEIAALAGTYRRKKTSDAVRDGQVVSENVMRTFQDAGTFGDPAQLIALRGIDTNLKGLDFLSPPPLTSDMIDVQRAGDATYNSAKDTDKIRRMKQLEEKLRNTRRNGKLAGMDRAQKLLTHYLDGSGDRYGFTDDTELGKIPAMQELRDKTIQETLAEAKAKGMTDGRPIPFQSDWKVVSPDKWSNFDFFLAHGNFSGAVSGLMNIDPDGSYTVTYVYHLYDYYDWAKVDARHDFTRIIGTSQEEIGQLNDYGFARNFVVTSISAPATISGKV